MVKVFKFFGLFLLGIVILVVAAVLTMPLWFGPVVKPTASTCVPKLTGTDFSIGSLSLNPYTGRLEVGSIELGNPAGYEEPTAASIGTLVVDVDMGTVAGDSIHIQEVTLRDVFVSYVKGGPNNVDNITQIRNNITGGDGKTKGKGKGEVEGGKTKVKGEKKVVIDRLTVSGVRVSFGMVTVPVPVDIVLTDIGRKSNGVTVAELCDQVWQAIFKQAMKLNDSAKLLGTILNDGTKKLGSQAGGHADKMVDVLNGLLK